MPELFVSALSAGPALSWVHVLVRLVVALGLGRLVAIVYTMTRTPAERTPSFPATLVLLAVLIAILAGCSGLIATGAGAQVQQPRAPAPARADQATQDILIDLHRLNRGCSPYPS